jgi:hypothetical protein
MARVDGTSLGHTDDRSTVLAAIPSEDEPDRSDVVTATMSSFDETS